MQKLIQVLIITASVNACKANVGSSLSVVNGGDVTSPEQSPGTYGLNFYYGDQLIGNGSTTAVGNNTFLTNGHIISNNNPIAPPATRVDIIDYKGNVVKSFDPKSNDVTHIVNPQFFSDNKATSANNDIGAYVFKEPIAKEKLTHGTTSIPNPRPDDFMGQDIYMVGNGIRDYKAKDYSNPEAFNPENEAGQLRWGSNITSGRDSGGIYIRGRAFSQNGYEGKNSVSGPGDSGGGVYSVKNGQKEFMGIMQGGSMYNPNVKDPSKANFDSNNPSADISSQPNNAYSYIVDISQQDKFLQQVSSYGGQINGRYIEPSSVKQESAYKYTGYESSVAEIAPPPAP